MIVGCGRGNSREPQAAYPTPLITDAEAIAPTTPAPTIEETLETESSSRPNFVDLRVELLTAIFRRAGRSEFTGFYNDYQRSLFDFLLPYREHPAVVFARDLPLGFDAVPNFAIHMKRAGNGFVLVDNQYFLFTCGRWTEESVATFIELVNDFYFDTGFGEFFASQTEHYENITEIFIRDVYSNLNHDWFYAHGVRPDQMRIVINPNHTQTGYGPSLWEDAYGTISASYSIVPGRYNYTGVDWLRLTVHEFNHTFANPIAARWYEENEAFRELSRASVGSIPWYPQSLTMAFEYVTRAYDILYLVENEDADPIPLLLDEMINGFPYIETVFAMITDYELMGIDRLLDFRLRGAYTLGDESHSYTHADGHTVSWRYVNFPEGFRPDPFLVPHRQFGNIFPTDTGDVLYVVCSHNHRQIIIDLGGFRGLRSYYIFPHGASSSSNFVSGVEIEDMIQFALGVDYYVNPEVHEFELSGGNIIRWHVIDLLGAALDIGDLFHVTYGNIFGTQTGDVILVIRDTDGQLYIDLGPGGWHPEIRSYFVLPVG